MLHPRHLSCALVTGLACLLGLAAASAAQSDDARKPSLSLRATPPVGFTPLRVQLIVDVRGGADDYEDFYCPSIEWDWGDGTVSENAADCDPYEPGKSQIRRRFSVQRVFRQGGRFQVVFRLKQKDRVVGIARTSLQVQQGSF